MSESNLPLWHRNLHFISLSQILFSHLVVNLEENCLYVYGSFIYCWGLKTNFGLQAPLSYYLMTLHTGICDVIFYEFPVGVINFCGKFQAIIVSTGNKLRLVESNHIAAVTPLLNRFPCRSIFLLQLQCCLSFIPRMLPCMFHHRRHSRFLSSILNLEFS